LIRPRKDQLGNCPNNSCHRQIRFDLSPSGKCSFFCLQAKAKAREHLNSEKTEFLRKKAVNRDVYQFLYTQGNHMNINQITSGGTNVTAVSPRENVKQAQISSATANESVSNKTIILPAAVSVVALKNSVDEINRFINSSNGVNLNIDNASGKVIVQIVDKKTNEVIRQIPSEEVLSIARDLGGKKGILLNDQA
jgi:flagellar protein FlaG